MYATYSTSDQQQLEAGEKPRLAVGPKYRRTDVTLGGCNTIKTYIKKVVFIVLI